MPAGRTDPRECTRSLALAETCTGIVVVGGGDVSCEQKKGRESVCARWAIQRGGEEIQNSAGVLDDEPALDKETS